MPAACIPRVTPHNCQGANTRRPSLEEVWLSIRCVVNGRRTPSELLLWTRGSCSRNPVASIPWVCQRILQGNDTTRLLFEEPCCVNSLGRPTNFLRNQHNKVPVCGAPLRGFLGSSLTFAKDSTHEGVLSIRCVVNGRRTLSERPSRSASSQTGR